MAEASLSESKQPYSAAKVLPWRNYHLLRPPQRRLALLKPPELGFLFTGISFWLPMETFLLSVLLKVLRSGSKMVSLPLLCLTGEGSFLGFLATFGLLFFVWISWGLLFEIIGKRKDRCVRKEWGIVGKMSSFGCLKNLVKCVWWLYCRWMFCLCFGQMGVDCFRI